MRVSDLDSIRIKLASPEDILSWSHGEVTKPETINYRTQRAEKDGLFCEKIFGPEKNYQCYCGKYRGIRYKEIVCDRCGVEITRSEKRRERMGHIKLASPVSHIWFLRGVPSRMGMVLDIPMQQLESVIYFAAYIITDVREEEKKKILEEIEKEYEGKLKVIVLKTKVFEKLESEKLKVEPPTKEPKKGDRTGTGEGQSLKEARDRAKEEVLLIKPLKIISEIEYYDLSLKYGTIFEAGSGAETLRKIFAKIDLKKELEKLEKKSEETVPAERRKFLRRLSLLRHMQKLGIKPEWMFLTNLPVLPSDLRPMVQLDGGRYASSDLNDLYRRVINRNNRLKYLLEIDAPEVIVRNEKRMLQEAVDSLIDNGMRRGVTTQATTGGKRFLKSLADMLKGKQGRFRQNLLGKRVDYSGRSVIVVGPELKLDQCGIPKKMALELFKPFVLQKILNKELAYNVRGASRLIEEETDEVWAILEEVVKNKLVLLNRAPTLHRLGIQAFYPILVEGEVIRVHPIVCKAFNADFDGDQMAVHLPLSKEAQGEAKDIMLSILNLLKPATGAPIATLYQDIILGCYFLTSLQNPKGFYTTSLQNPKGFYTTKTKPDLKKELKIFSDKEEAILAEEFGVVGIQDKIKVRLKGKLIETSVGRIIFNQALPNDFSFQNEKIDVRKLEKIAARLIEKYPAEKVGEILDKIKSLGFEYSTFSGATWGMDDLIVPPQKPKIVAAAEDEIEQIENYYKKGFLSGEERKSKIIEVWTKVKSEIEKLIPTTLPPDGAVFSMVDAGARGGSWAQSVQMSGMKGLVINPMGEIIELPVKSSYKEGLSVLEYFISTHGARKGTADTALRTSTAGYLTRRLVEVAHSAITLEEDCRDEKGIEIFLEDAAEIGQDFVYKIVGRVSLEDVKGKIAKGKNIVKKGELIDWEKARKIAEEKIEKIKVRSPLSCKSIRGLCQKCYGWDLGKNQLVRPGQAVGIVAAQAIGEPGTQLTMRTFHTGGVAGGGDITFGLPRVQEIFEARIPGGKAEISPVSGKILEITSARIIKIKPDAKSPAKRDPAKGGEKIIEYEIPPNLAI
ncbi:DNA-directed RNA polymerase subunit beta', partial [Patescibacteria group bacterium]|nr:DNA-directed RNA polymerase subunit beta' [Patescibacteria group bacterium]